MEKDKKPLKFKFWILCAVIIGVFVLLLLLLRPAPSGELCILQYPEIVTYNCTKLISDYDADDIPRILEEYNCTIHGVEEGVKFKIIECDFPYKDYPLYKVSKIKVYN